MTPPFDAAVRARLRAPRIRYAGTVLADGAPRVSPVRVGLEAGRA